MFNSKRNQFAFFITIVFLLLTLSFSKLKAQNNISIQDTVIEKVKQLSDTAAVKYLSSIISDVVFIEPQKAKKYINYYTDNFVKSDSHRLCYTYNINGMIYEMLGKYEKALEYDIKALNIAEKIHDSLRIVYCNTNIGMVYYSYNDQFKKALTCFRKALSTAKSINNYGETSGAYSNIGTAHSNLGNLDSSIFCQYKALHIREKYGTNSLEDQRAIAIIYSNIAFNFFKLNKKDSAYYYKYKCVTLLNKNHYDFEVTDAYFGLAYYYKIDNKLDSAEKYINKALNISKRLGLRNKLKRYFSFYAELLFTKGNYKKAYELLNEHTLLSDTIHSQESRKKIAELQAQYDNESYLRKIEKLEFTAKKEKLQKIIYVSSFIAILVVLSGILILVLIKKKRDKIIAIQKEELLHKENELAQIQQKELNTKLEYKNKQLTTHTLSMLKKNRFLQELDKDIRDIGKIVNPEYKSKFKRLTTLIKYNSKSDNEWDLFKNYFEDVNQDFYQKLSQRFPDLSPGDYKICALIRLNMNIKESAAILNISPGSLKTSRYRLRRKLCLEPKEDLHGFIQSI